MTRYTVWHSTGKRDGDSGHDSLDEACAEFDHQVDRREVCEVELIDNTDEANPVTLRRYSADQTADQSPTA